MTDEHPDKSGNEGAQVAAVVPASVRADGSVRKERRIRPGYIPQELVPKYTPPSQRKLVTTLASNSFQELHLSQELRSGHVPPSQRRPAAILASNNAQKPHLSEEHRPTTPLASVQPKQDPPRESQAKPTKEAGPKKYIPPHARKATAIAVSKDEGDMLADSLAQISLKGKAKKTKNKAKELSC